MLYLEDYLEMIEHLPQELRDRFTDIRELDLTVQNNMDSIDKKIRVFFIQCKRNELKEEAIEAERDALRKDYNKVLEDADEKVSIAGQIHDLVERYLRRLDNELFKFKCELEADNNGITEILEKRSLEMDGGSAVNSLINVMNINQNQKENRYFGSMSSTTSTNSHGIPGLNNTSISGATVTSPVPTPLPPATLKDNRYRTPKAEKRRDSLSNIPEKRSNLGNNLTPNTSNVNSVRPGAAPNMTHAVLNSASTAITTPDNSATVAYNLQQLGVAASQAIVATQQMPQGRRTASLKASYEAIHNSSGGPPEFWISRDIANATTVAAHYALHSPVNEKKQKKKLNATAIAHGTVLNNSATLNNPMPISSSSSTVSMDSVDVLPTPTGSGNSVNLTNLGLSVVPSGVGGSSPAVTTTIVPNRSGSTATSSVLTPGTNVKISDNGLVVEQATDNEWSYDPNEPRYCTCNQVSYGDMVACDNDACLFEWFHYPCVGITQPPKGKWYCPKCTATMRRRANRKN